MPYRYLPREPAADAPSTTSSRRARTSARRWSTARATRRCSTRGRSGGRSSCATGASRTSPGARAASRATCTGASTWRATARRCARSGASRAPCAAATCARPSSTRPSARTSTACRSTRSTPSPSRGRSAPRCPSGASSTRTAPSSSRADRDVGVTWERLEQVPWLRRERFGGLEYHVVETPDGERYLRRWFVGVAEPREKPRGVGDDEPWVHVDVSEQTLVLYRGAMPIYATLVSSGLEGHDTPARRVPHPAQVRLGHDGEPRARRRRRQLPESTTSRGRSTSTAPSRCTARSGTTASACSAATAA